jgi:hypothetical protein
VPPVACPPVSDDLSAEAIRTEPAKPALTGGQDTSGSRQSLVADGRVRG